MSYYSDRSVAPGITMSLSAIYNKRMNRQAKIVKLVVQQALPCLHKLLDIPKNVAVRIAPIKARGTHGRYINGENLCEIDCRLSWDQALEVLCHEMVHAEQYHTGRLGHTVDRRGPVHMWNGSIEYNRGSTYKTYRQQPWEIEAFSRQKELADKVNEMLGG